MGDQAIEFLMMEISLVYTRHVNMDLTLASDCPGGRAELGKVVKS